MRSIIWLPARNCSFLDCPHRHPTVLRVAGRGDGMAAHRHGNEGLSRGARMLRTALGPAIACYLEDPAIVEVMLNPDGRLWVDRLREGLVATDEVLI